MRCNTAKLSCTQTNIDLDEVAENGKTKSVTIVAAVDLAVDYPIKCTQVDTGHVAHRSQID